MKKIPFSSKVPTEISIHRHGISLVIWPNPLGTCKIVPEGGSDGCSQVLNVYKDEISHHFTNVRRNELSDVCIIREELGMIRK